MAAFPVKALAVVAGIGGVTATGAGIIYLTSNSSQPDQNTSKQKTESDLKKTAPLKIDTIIGFLKEDRKVLLTTTGNEPEWNINWKSFKQKYNKDNIGTSSWVFDGWDGALDGEVATLPFKAKCKTNSENIKSKTDPLYEEVKNYCTKATENA